MRTPIIAGNWKMHKTIAEAVQLAHEIREALTDIKGVEVVYARLLPLSARLKG